MFCMESKVIDVYSMYNSTINDGRRIRRMRRTQLSAQKVEKCLSAKRGSNTKIRSHEKQSSNSYSKSRPKIQPKWSKENQVSSKASHQKIVQNQYYNECTIVSDFHRNNNKNSNQRISLTNRKNNQTDKSRQRNAITNAENSYGQIMKNNQSTNRKKNQDMKSNKSQSQYSSKPHLNLPPKIIQQFNTSKRSVSKRSQTSQRENIKYSITQQKTQKKEEKSLINQYGLKSKLGKEQKQQKKQIEPNPKYSSNRHSSIKQSSMSEQSNLVPKPSSHINKNRNTQVPIRLKTQKSKQSIKKQSQIQVIPNQSNFSSAKHSQIEKNTNTVKKSAEFFKKESKLSNQFSSAISKNLHSNSNKSSRISKQNFSKLRPSQRDPIINSSGPRQELWKETLQSLDIVKIKDQIKNDTEKHDNQRDSNMKDSRKIELKLQSDREEMNSSIAKFKYLPLASKDFTGRRSIDSLSVKTTQPGTLKAFLQNVQIHDLLIDMIADLKQQILYFNQEVQNPDHEILAYLLQKKHMYEKSLVTKTLRGLQRNVFNTSTAQIQKEQLKKYIGKQQVKTLITSKQKQNMSLFKQLQTKYFEIRQKNKNNPFIKLQNKVDDYSKQIIRRLEEYYNDLFKKFTQTNSNINQQEQTQTLENRIFNVMEVAFLITQLSGKRIKKTEFFQDISDIDQYFENYQETLQEVFQYFRNLN